MSADDILDLIDGAIGGYTSRDAMRWRPEPAKADREPSVFEDLFAAYGLAGELNLDEVYPLGDPRPVVYQDSGGQLWVRVNGRSYPALSTGDSYRCLRFQVDDVAERPGVEAALSAALGPADRDDRGWERWTR